jgi:hypothetical protein
MWLCLLERLNALCASGTGSTTTSTVTHWQADSTFQVQVSTATASGIALRLAGITLSSTAGIIVPLAIYTTVIIPGPRWLQPASERRGPGQCSLPAHAARQAPRCIAPGPGGPASE